MVSNWGTYYPVLWNCQHFSLFIAQLAIGTHEFSDLATRILNTRNEFVWDVVIKRNIACMAVSAAGKVIPVVGVTVGRIASVVAGGYMLTDVTKWKAIGSKWAEFRDRYHELQRIHWVLPMK